jgi:D-alanyl-D-alanine carboxypeptidase/D-alanyl-D-alanine-endopeptidase (penicillin-binding protein 4)
MYLNPRVGAEFRSSLSIGGRDGTLRSRFKEERESGLIRGKTGTLDGVHCLAGYVEALDGEVYAFAFLANDITGPVSRVRRAQTAFAETLFAGSTPPAEPRTEDAEPAGS